MAPGALSIFPSPSKNSNLDLSKSRLSNFTRASTELKGFALRLATSNEVTEISSAADGIQSAWSASTTSPPPSFRFKDRHSGRQYLKKRPSTPSINSNHSLNAVIRNKSADSVNVVSPISLNTRPSALGSASIDSFSPTSIYSSDTRHTSYSSTRHSGRKSSTHNTEFAKIDRPFPPRSHSLRSGISVNSSNTGSDAADKSLPSIPDAVENEKSIKTAATQLSSLTEAKLPPAPPLEATLPRCKSIFPEYDPDKSLSQQQYYPQADIAQPQSILKQSSTELNTVKHNVQLDRKDSAVMIGKSYECIPQPEFDDIVALWAASTRPGACAGRKVQLQLFRSSAASQTTYEIVHEECKLFSMTMQRQAKDKSTRVKVDKFDPHDHVSQLLANITLPQLPRSQTLRGTDTIPLFPHQAAVDALAAASNTHKAADIARFDPDATSRAAERLAMDVVTDAQTYYTSDIVRTIYRGATPASNDTTYELRHSTAGVLPITVSQSSSRNATYFSTRDRKIKICVHHPSATSIMNDDLALLSIDFATNSCVVDLPALFALDAEYMLDTALSAVFTTAAIEFESTCEEMMSFAAPPKIAVNDSKRGRGRGKNGAKKGLSKGNPWALRKTGSADIDDSVDRMPAVAQGTLAALELGIHGAFWLLEKGVKAIDERSASRNDLSRVQTM